MLDLPFTGAGTVTGVTLQFHLIKLIRACRKLKLPVTKRGDRHPNQVLSRTPRFSNLMPVNRGSQIEDEEGKEKANSRNPVAKAPSDIFLDVDEAESGEKSAQEWAEHPPVEEGDFHLLLGWVEVVELVSTKGRDVRFRASSTKGDGIERYIEEGYLWRCGFAAYAIVARWF